MKVIKFLKWYSLEIYSAITICFLAYTWFVDTNTIQQFVIIWTVLLLFHEWEENAYPWGFIDMYRGNVGLKYNETLRRNSRVYTSILIFLITLIPFFMSDKPYLILPLGYLCFLEWCVHTVIWSLFWKVKPYSPGWITAIIEFIWSLYLFYYLISNNLITWWEWIITFLLFFCVFILMYLCLIFIEWLDVTPLLKKIWIKK
jgi:hypothetical protein